MTNPDPNAPAPDLLTVREAAALLRVTKPTIRRWIAEGRLPASRIGRGFRLDRSRLSNQLIAVAA